MDITLIKLTFIKGLQEVVLDELTQYSKFTVHEKTQESIYLIYRAHWHPLLSMRSVTNVYIVKQSETLHPRFISKHKSILGEMIDVVRENSIEKFKTYTLSCAGENSEESIAIKNFVANTYKLSEKHPADLEIFIGKVQSLWEVGVRITSRPLSLRSYKVENIPGALNPTIAYAMNSFCNLTPRTSYLNVFSGSGTLLIEAGLHNKEMKLHGFDTNGKTIARAVNNIKKAGLIKHVTLSRADIFDAPDFGIYKVITSDLPFGMQISKGEDLEKLYKAFAQYCKLYLDKGGTLVTYTTEHELLQRLLEETGFEITKTLPLKVSTVTGQYISPVIFVCKHLS